MAYLVGGVVFGLILEYIEVNSGGGYTYGRFWVMFGKAPLDIPLCIGIGWGIIIYTARAFTDSLGLGLWASAALDTLLALNIDLSMDTVAYRLHMWNWNWQGTHLNPLAAHWFGVPWGNFFGWQMVVFFYSASSRLFEKALVKIGNAIAKVVLTTFLALFCAEIFLFAMELYLEGLMYRKLGITSLHRFLGALIILIVIVLSGWRYKKVSSSLVPPIAWVVPAWLHLFFFSCLFICGFYTENKWMTIAACINLAIGVIVHVAPVRFGGKKPDTIKKITAFSTN